jgi:hypothetical protein
MFSSEVIRRDQKRPEEIRGDQRREEKKTPRETQRREDGEREVLRRGPRGGGQRGRGARAGRGAGGASKSGVGRFVGEILPSPCAHWVRNPSLSLSSSLGEEGGDGKCFAGDLLKRGRSRTSGRWRWYWLRPL